MADFATWVNGAPLIESGDGGGDFATWVDGAPLIGGSDASTLPILARVETTTDNASLISAAATFSPGSVAASAAGTTADATLDCDAVVVIVGAVAGTTDDATLVSEGRLQISAAVTATTDDATLDSSSEIKTRPIYSGSLLPIFAVPPNWAEPVRLRVLDRVLVREALDRSEERLGSRPRPLYGLRYTALYLSEQETGYIRRSLELAEALPIAMPAWVDQVKLTATAAPGATTIAVDSTANSLWATLRSYALLWRAFNDWELVELDAVEENTLTAVAGLTREWEEGAIIVPLMFGWLRRDDATNLDSDHASFEVDFEERFTRYPPIGEFDAQPPEEPEEPDPYCGDEFEQYSTGEYATTSHALNKGYCWIGAWELDANPDQAVAEDEFETYPVGAIGVINGGSGWGGAWTI